MSKTKHYLESLNLRSLQQLQDNKGDDEYLYRQYLEQSEAHHTHLLGQDYYNRLSSKEWLDRIKYTKGI